ncbi:uncharacterized protein At4g15970 [Cryptomeria japonica]|uniref:uncharacterized protein At4g15970 n=1 Tax=Cryptomeria japonica TaxID=3369 RepID=UPI0027DAA22D|nr:uncharacterized protein At4g15970 [Cryptomeria japonica]
MCGMWRTRSSVLILLFVALISLTCVILFYTASPNQLIKWLPAKSLSLGNSWARGIKLMKEYPELDSILQKADMGNKTVIITTLNYAWATPDSMIDLFLESFHTGEGTSRFLNNLVIVSLDQKAYNRCTSIHSHCFILKTKGIDFSGEKRFMTDDYLKMMWRRIEFLRAVLEMGYSFIFTDADIMWFRNPFDHLATDADFQIACDRYNGNPTDLNNAVNGGFNYVKSNDRTIQFYRYWYSSHKLYPGKHDQDVLNYIKHNEEIRKMGLSMRFLDTSYFGGFCEPRKDFTKICTMHANCCVGLKTKLHDLRLMLTDWKNFQSLAIQDRLLQEPLWRTPMQCKI